MNPIRFVFVVAAIVFFNLAVINVVFWHSFYWLPIAWYALIVFFLAIFEVGRYRRRYERSATWRATGERFFDPTSGEATTVYYDPATGKRDYRTATTEETPR